MKITITNTLEVISTKELKRRGLTFVCKNLAGEFVYRATDKALEWLKQNFKDSTKYENDNGDMVSI